MVGRIVAQGRHDGFAAPKKQKCVCWIILLMSRPGLQNEPPQVLGSRFRSFSVGANQRVAFVGKATDATAKVDYFVLRLELLLLKGCALCPHVVRDLPECSMATPFTQLLLQVLLQPRKAGPDPSVRYGCDIAQCLDYC